MMPFEIARTGLISSQDHLDVTGNNIANASSVGFKHSRAEFADTYSQSIYEQAGVDAGQGSLTVDIAQQFAQGSTRTTDNVLDMAIEGDGFFVNSMGQDTANVKYTRQGAYRLDSNNFLVNAFDDFLMTYAVDEFGNSTDLNTIQSLQIPTVSGEPEATQNVNLSMNLPILDSSEAKRLSEFNPKDSKTYNTAAAVPIYDSLGTQHMLRIYYVKPAVERPVKYETDKLGELMAMDYRSVDASFDFVDPKGSYIREGDGSLSTVDPATNPAPTPDAFDNQSLMFTFYELDGQPINPVQNGVRTSAAWNYSYTAEIDYVETVLHDQMQDTDYPILANGNRWHGAALFSSRGLLDQAIPGIPMQLEPLESMDTPVASGGVDPQQLTINYSNSTMFDAKFQVYEASADGNRVGALALVDIEKDGLIRATYDNDTYVPLGRVAMVKFNNPQGLQQVGDTSWLATTDSGEAIYGQAASVTGFGRIRASALEESNVQMNVQLIELIIAQRNYQANAKMIETENTMQEAILQI
jgi:flagellar hook protein FlgE